MRKLPVVSLLLPAVLVVGCGDDSGGVPELSSTTGPTIATTVAVSGSATSTTSTSVPPTTTSAGPPTTTTTTAPDFEPFETSGNSDDLVDVQVPAGQPAIVTIVYEGGENLTVFSYDADDQQIDLLVNHFGDYTGTRPINLREGRIVSYLQINTSGPWTIRVAPLAHAPSIADDGTAAGVGDAVIIDPTPPADTVQGAWTHDGSNMFFVRSWISRDGGLALVSAPGAYDGSVLVPAGTYLYDIIADGAWTLDLDG